MPVNTTINELSGIYFITFTCYKWIPIIDLSNGYSLVYNWFDYLKKQGHFVCGYVIMPNHVHVLIGFKNSGKSINTIVGNGKRFMAYGFIKKLKQLDSNVLLQYLNESVRPTDKSRKKLHEVWEDSFDWKVCYNTQFINQKLDYIHKNPCKGNWMLSPSPSDYLHSSARFYLTGEHAAYAVTNYMELEDIDLFGY